MRLDRRTARKHGCRERHERAALVGRDDLGPAQRNESHYDPSGRTGWTRLPIPG
jgi:hypothetical protein